MSAICGVVSQQLITQEIAGGQRAGHQESV
jgi:hypothetical protein